MDMVKSVLHEELDHSLKTREHYLSVISELPRGILSKKKINGREYNYLLYREGSKVKTSYLGKLSENEIQDLIQKIDRRKYYKKMLKEVQQKVNYLNKVLNVKTT